MAKATYCNMIKHGNSVPESNPPESDIVSISHENHSRYGARCTRAVLVRREQSALQAMPSGYAH